MNNKVVQVPSDEDDVVKLAVYDLSGSRVDEDSIVWIDESALASAKTISFNIRVDSSTVEGLSDIQYVVETDPFNNAPDVPSSAPNAGAPTPRMPAAPSPIAPAKRSTTGFSGASAGGGVLCEGRRSHARGKNGYVSFVLAADTLKDSASKEDAQILSEVWGGWAEGHSKVTLTPKIYFKLREKSEATNKDEL